MAYGDFRDLSKQGYSGTATAENINICSLQRIADAAEMMASNYISLQNDRDLYEKWWKGEREKTAKLRKRIAALQGVITRMKKKKEGK